MGKYSSSKHFMAFTASDEKTEACLFMKVPFNDREKEIFFKVLYHEVMFRSVIDVLSGGLYTVQIYTIQKYTSLRVKSSKIYRVFQKRNNF